MEFLTLSEKQIKNSSYSQIRDKHIVISISGGDEVETVIPANVNRLNTLHLKFDDVEDIEDEYIYFTRGEARDILEFVNRYCSQISLIIVQSKEGLSRNIAIASALSKILNNRDDFIFTKGVPNMLIYTTLLDCFYSNQNWQTTYSRINYLKIQSMCETLSPNVVKSYTNKRLKV